MSLNKFRKRMGIILLSAFFIITAHKNFAQQKEQVLHNLNVLLVNTVMEDLFTPPIASRIYVYPNIAFLFIIK